MINIIQGISVKYEFVKTALININGKLTNTISCQRRGIYGLFSKPLPQTVTTIIKNGQKAIVLFEENPSVKIELKDGEVALFDGINKIHLKREGGITIGGDGAQKLITETFITLFNAHTHGAVGGTTTTPTVPLVAEAITTKRTEAL